MRVRALLTAGVLAATLLFVPVPQARADADGCENGVRSDFNGDGYSDAVVADPGATVSGQAGAGHVAVLFGDADDRIGEGAGGVIYQGMGGVGGVPEAGDHFGAALAALDANCDGYTDLAVGIPDEDLGGVADTGQVSILFGGPIAFAAGPVHYSMATFGQPLLADARFGAALDGMEDVGQGGTPEPDAFVLAIGAPGTTVEGAPGAGAVALLAPEDGNLSEHWISQATEGIPGSPEPGDAFGAAVTCGYLAGSGEIDCVVGAPSEDVGSETDAGTAVLVTDVYFTGEYTGTTLDQSSAGVPGTPETNDRYGFAVDSVLVGATSRLAIGAPGEQVGSDAKAGMVQLYSGNTATLNPGTGLSQDTSGVGGSTESGDRFGYSVAWMAPGGGDPHTRLAVGAPYENTTGGTDAGIVQLFRTSSLAADVTYSQNSTGVPGAAGDDDRFGFSVALIAGADERALVVGVPYDGGYANGIVDVIPIGGGSPRAWVPGVGAVPLAGANAFGQALAGVNGSAE